MQGFCTNTEYTGSLGYNSVSDGCLKKNQNMYPVMGEKQLSKRLGGIKGCEVFKEKSERYITSRNGWVSLKGIFRWYICRRDPSTYQNTPGPSGHTNV